MTLDQFFADCGVVGRPQLIVEGPGGVEPGGFAVERPFLVIGRGERADLRLDHEKVSNRHAYLQFLGGRPLIVDLGSRTGLHWSGEARPSGWLDGPEGVAIGPYRIRFDGAGQATGERPERNPLASDEPEAAATLPRVVLEFLGRRVSYPPWPLDRELTLIGRARDCKVRLGGLEVSKYHCALVRTPGGIWVVDLLSRAGVVVHDALTHWARLLPGDDFVVAGQTIRLGMPRPPRGLNLPARATPPTVPERLRATAAEITTTDPQQTAMVESLIEHFGQMQHQMFDQFQQSMMMVLQMFGTMHRDQLGLLREELDELRRANANGHEPPGPPPKGNTTTPAQPTPSASRPSPEPNRRRPPEAAAPTPHTTPDAPLTNSDMHAILARRIATLQDNEQGRWQKILAMIAGRENGNAMP